MFCLQAGTASVQSANSDVRGNSRGSVSDDDDDDDDDVKDGGGSSSDHVVRFFIINNVSRATSRTSDDVDDDDDDASSEDESTDASRLELIVEQVSHQQSTQLVASDWKCGNYIYTSLFTKSW